jgi:putative peptidoglycan lipid II flippase
VSNPKLPNVAAAGAIMMAGLFLSRILGQVRDTIMAAKFGLGPATDAYVLAFQIPDLLFFLIAGGALSSAFIPVFSEYLHTGREDEAWHVFSVVTTVMTLAIGLFVVLATIFAVPLTEAVAGGKSPELIPLIAHMSRILLPAQLAFFLGGLMFGTLYARQRFVAPGLGPNVYNLGIIFGALVLSSFVQPPIVGMAWGAVVGAFIGNFLIPLYVMRRLGSRFSPSLDLRHPGVAKVFRLMLPVVLGLSLPGVYGIIMRAFGSYFTDGINTALDYSNKLMQAPLGVFGQSFAIAVFPALAQFFAQGRMDLYRDQLVRTMRTVVYITLPISAVMFVLAPDVVTLLFQYGKFSATDTGAVAPSLRMFALGIAAWCLQPVLMRAFFAVQTTLKPILLGSLVTALFFGLAWVLKSTPLGYLGLPLASSIAALVLAMLLLVAIHRHIGDLDLRGFGVTVLKALLATAVMAGLMWAGDQVLPQGEGLRRNLWALGRLALLGLGSAWVYYGLTRAMKMPETDTVARALARLDRRKSREGQGPRE